MKTSLLISPVLFFLWSCQSGKSETKISKPPVPKEAVTPVPNLSEKEKKRYGDLVSNFLNTTLLKGKFNGSILIAKNGVPVYEKYIGYKNIKTREPLTAETPLQIASTSKPFTAAAILRLAQEGKLKLSDPISFFFPGFPYPDVTVRTLLNHRSGLPNYLYYMENAGWDRTVPATNYDVLSTLLSWQPPRAFRPNSNFNYSNTNYVLLALIVEKVSGIPFPIYMKNTFFDPYGMKNTYVHTISDSASTTPSYDGYGGEWILDFSDGPYGDKNIYSTPRDLLKWDQAWYNGAVLHQPLIDSVFVAYSNERASVHNYGLGWRLLTMPNKKKIIYHNGRWHGFNSAFARLPEEKITIIMLTNKFNRNVYFVSRRMYTLFGDYAGKDEGKE